MTNNKIVFENEKEKLNHLYEEGKQKAQDAYRHGEKKVNEAIEKGEEKTQDFYQQAKVAAGEIYQEGRKIVNETKDYLHTNSDEIINAVREKPLSALLIASGVGFILYNLLKK